MPLFSTTIPSFRCSNDVQNDCTLLVLETFHIIEVHTEEINQDLRQSELKWENSEMKSLIGLHLNKTIIPVWFDQNLVDEKSEKQRLGVDVACKIQNKCRLDSNGETSGGLSVTALSVAKTCFVRYTALTPTWFSKRIFMNDNKQKEKTGTSSS